MWLPIHAPKDSSTSLIFWPDTHNLNPIMKKEQTSPNLWTVYKITSLNFYFI